MIELRHLDHFVTVCRHVGLTEAAQDLGIALSTLSSSLKALEDEFGLALFRRSNFGLYPLASARWLYRAASSVLQAEAFGRRWVSAAGRKRPGVLTLQIELNFTFGRLNNAIAQAIEALAATHPLTLVTPVWPGEKSPDCAAKLAEEQGFASHGRIVIDMIAGPTEHRKREAVLIADRWVLGCRMPAHTLRLPPVAQLFAGPVFIPALHHRLMTQVTSYLHMTEIAGVRFVGDHPAALPGLFTEHKDAAVFAPESLFSPQLGLARIGTVAPDPPLEATILGKMEEANPVAAAFLDHLRHALKTSKLLKTPKARRSRAAVSSRKIRYFNMLYRLRRVAAAAQAANIAQPALSDQLQQLEHALQAQLFERRSDGLIPTASGERFAPVAAALEHGLQAIAVEGASAQTLPGGRLSLGVLPSVSQHGFLINKVAEALLTVQSRHPKTRLVVMEGPNETLQNWVVKGLVGLAIVETGPPTMPRLSLSAAEPLAAIAHPRHGLLPEGPVTLAALAGIALALPGNLFGLRQLLDTAAREKGVALRPHMEIDALAMLITILSRHPLCTVLPPSAVQRELDRGELVAHMIVEPKITRRLFVIHSGDRSLTAAERDLVSTLRARLAFVPSSEPAEY